MNREKMYGNMRTTAARPQLQILLFASILACRAPGGDWPRFRGPNGSGVSETANPPVVFGPETNVAWKTDLPPGHSSPILAAGRIFVTGFEGKGQLVTFCLDLHTGEQLWRRSVTR